LAPRLAVALTVFAAVAGCGGSGPKEIPTVPIRGSVRFKGKPAAGAIVVLHPTGGAQDLMTLRPQAECDAQGCFQVRTYREGDGAPVGDYRVSIVWPTPSRDFWGVPLHEIPPAERTVGPDRLARRYENPDRSGLRIAVGPDPTSVPPFELR
jgi:hypothetical protein